MVCSFRYPLTASAASEQGFNLAFQLFYFRQLASELPVDPETFVKNVGCRKPDHAILFNHLIIADDDRIIDPVSIAIRLDVRGPARLHGDSNYLDSTTGILRLESVEGRNLRQTGAAPGRPKIQNDDTAFQIRCAYLSPV